MRLATRLPARVRKLEEQLIPTCKGPTYIDRLIAFRIVFFALHDHDRGVPDYKADKHAFERIMKTFNATEPQIRRFVHDGLDEFGSAVDMPPDRSPLTGMVQGAAS